MENQEYPNSDFPKKALEEYNQNKQEKKKKEETKEYYEECDHAYTIKSLGWKICVTCGLCLRRLITFPTDDYYEDEDRVFIKDTGPDKEIRDTMNKLMGMIVRESRECKDTGEIFYTEPPEAGLPRELFDYSKELCDECYNYALPNHNVCKKKKHKSPFSPIRCHIHSLCAAVLWKIVKSLYTMSINEFSKKCGVSKPTIINMCKKMKQIDSN